MEGITESRSFKVQFSVSLCNYLQSTYIERAAFKPSAQSNITFTTCRAVAKQIPVFCSPGEKMNLPSFLVTFKRRKCFKRTDMT